MWNDTMFERTLREVPQMSVELLTTAERFVLGACRCWDAFMDDPDPALAWRELTPVFAYMNVMGALCAFDRTFTALHRFRPQTLRFRDTDSMTLGLDEGRMLCGLASLQRGEARAAIEVLRGSLTRHAIPSVLPPLARIASILDGQGHRLPAWDDVRRRTAPVPAGETSSPPLYRAQ
jgi:hypothetical protein